MNNILLISEDFLKTNSAINDNLFGKYCLPAIREAQDMNLQPILGSCLYNTILGMINTNTISDTENEPYKALLDDYIQQYLLYQVQANLVPIINVKNGNIGTVVASDEYIQTLSQGNVDLVGHYFQERADFYARRMQKYILEHHEDYPEMKECDCERLRANLKTASTTGLWLGGTRGQIYK